MTIIIIIVISVTIIITRLHIMEGCIAAIQLSQLP